MLHNQLRRVIARLCFLDAALEIPRKSLLTPWAFRRIADRRECGGGLVWFLRGEIYRECAMPTHAVPEDRLARPILQTPGLSERIRHRTNLLTMGIPFAAMTSGSSSVTCVYML